MPATIAADAPAAAAPSAPAREPYDRIPITGRTGPKPGY